MKSVSFFRNSWRKRSKDRKAAKEKEKTPMEEKTATSVPCTPATATFCPFDHGLLLPLPAHKIRSQSEEVIKAPPINFKGGISSDGGSSVCSLVDRDAVKPSSVLSFDCGCQSRTNPTHNPPKSTSDSPRHYPVPGMRPGSAGGLQPVRPPRPPPLNLHSTTTRRPVNTGISPRPGKNCTVALTVASNPRVIKSTDLITTPYRSSKDSPGSSGDRKQLCQSSGTITPNFRAPDGAHPCPQRDALRGMNMVANLPRPYANSSLPVMTSPRAAHVLWDLSDPPATQRLYSNSSGLRTSSTPHLLSRDGGVPLLPSGPSNRQAHDDDALAVSLSSFPTPPQIPLFTRRKVAKNFALRPASPSLSSHSPTSSVLTSFPHTPLVTPTTPRPHTSPYYSKSYSSLPRCSSAREVPPLLYDPPSTPLPTPPTSPGAEPSTPSNSLRSVKSNNQLYSKLLPPIPPPTHRVTSSVPTTVPEGQPCVKQLGCSTQSRPEKQRDFQPPTSQLAISDSQTQWGYAL